METPHTADTSANSRRIARNTLLLYFRMFITLIVGLYTSRVILDSLGIDDYGIYNLVGGFVAMFYVVRSGLVSATQRFITYDLGKGDLRELNVTFSTCVIIYLVLSLLVIIVAESIGYWFIENKLVIPLERLDAAKWVFHLSLLSLVFSLISFPHNALIISHERMSAFAYISIYEVVAKLVVTFLIYISPFDKLVIYAILMCVVQITVPALYYYYCKKNFSESKICWIVNWRKIKQIYAFTGWAMLGGIAGVGLTQGLSVVLGMFFAPAINAARGVAVQIQGTVLQFASNFQMAVDPQIIKSYANDDKAYLRSLVCASAKYSYYLLCFISLPVMLEADYLLSLWLVEVPQYSALFFRLIFIATLFDAFSGPFTKVIHASGNIRNYQLICSTLLIAVVPFSYMALKVGADAYYVFVIHIIIGFIVMVVRIYLSSKIASIPFNDILTSIISPLLIVSVVSVVVPLSMRLLMDEGFVRFFVVCITSFLSFITIVYYYGISESERVFINDKIKNIKTKFHKE